MSSFRTIARFAMNNNISPSELSDANLQCWEEQQHNERKADRYIQTCVRMFRQTRVEFNLDELCQIAPPSVPCTYGTPWADLPQSFREELVKVCRWKTSKWSPGRPRRATQREITAESMKQFICRLHGYAARHHSITAVGMEELVTEPIIHSYIDWYINEQHRTFASLKTFLSMLPNIFRFCPAYCGRALPWLEGLLRALPMDSPTVARERKEQKWVDYEILCGISTCIAQDAADLRSPRSRAKYARNALMIEWLTYFPWRQRNLRECRLATSATEGNIFKGPLPASFSMALPDWVKEAVRENPSLEVWQFRFLDHQTKGRRSVRGILPRPIVPMLEEYIRQHRPMLIDGKDDGILFPNDAGRPQAKTSVTYRIEGLTKRYAGRSVNPHLFRDIFTRAWLRDHPGDILTAQKGLWHQNGSLAADVYGAAFDEAEAVCRIERWREEKACKRMPSGR
jgi:hypothetical protein